MDKKYLTKYINHFENKNKIFILVSWINFSVYSV